MPIFDIQHLKTITVTFEFPVFLSTRQKSQNQFIRLIRIWDTANFSSLKLPFFDLTHPYIATIAQFEKVKRQSVKH